MKTNSRLFSNILFNFGGQAVPLIVGLFTMPFLIARFGDDRFGLLSISWMVVGYLSLFDFGLGRAMTRQVAVKIGMGLEDDIPRVFWSATWAMLGFGIIATLLGLLASPYLTEYLNVPSDLRREAEQSLMVLSVGIPVTILSTGFRGFLEAFQQFRLVAIIRLANGLVTFLVPAAIALSSTDIAWVVGGLVVARLGVNVLSMAFCLRVFPKVRAPRAPSRSDLSEMLQIGGWMTVSNFVSPIMTTLDRFILGGIVAVSAVTYYATPADVLNRTLIIPAALTGVLFPAFASSLHANRGDAYALFARAWNGIFYILYPILLVSVIFAEFGLEAWLGLEFADRSAGVVKWLSFGVLANGLAQLPYSLLQSAGRSKLVAGIHLLELPVYIGILVYFVSEFGITGAAIAWTVRTSLDLFALLFSSMWITGGSLELPRQTWLLQISLVVLMALGGLISNSTVLAIIVLTLGLGIATAYILKLVRPYVVERRDYRSVRVMRFLSRRSVDTPRTLE